MDKHCEIVSFRLSVTTFRPGIMMFCNRLAVKDISLCMVIMNTCHCLVGEKLSRLCTNIVKPWHHLRRKVSHLHTTIMTTSSREKVHFFFFHSLFCLNCRVKFSVGEHTFHTQITLWSLFFTNSRLLLVQHQGSLFYFVR